MDALVVWLPTLVWGAIFFFSYRREPRQFRNAFFFFFFATSALGTLTLVLGQWWISLPIAVALLLSPFITIGFMIANQVILVRREGFSLSNSLPLLFTLAMIGWFVIFPFMMLVGAPSPLIVLSMAVVTCGAWFFFSFAALLLYSWFYRALPKRRRYDYIVIHGAGLMGEELTPLLKGRVDKALELWEKQGRTAILIPSGGQGADEIISEADAMHRYLITRGVPKEKILDEDTSTTTLENLSYSQRLIASRSHATAPRTALVTSDYHVFRTAMYARSIGFNADGIGSKTARYYFPTAFIREFIAITRTYWLPYAIIGGLWFVGYMMMLLIDYVL